MKKRPVFGYTKPVKPKRLEVSRTIELKEATRDALIAQLQTLPDNAFIECTGGGCNNSSCFDNGEPARMFASYRTMQTDAEYSQGIKYYEQSLKRYEISYKEYQKRLAEWEKWREANKVEIEEIESAKRLVAEKKDKKYKENEVVRLNKILQDAQKRLKDLT